MWKHYLEHLDRNANQRDAGHTQLVFYAPRKKFGGAYSRRLVRPSVSPSVRPSVRLINVRPITLLFEVGFQNYFT